MTLLYMRYHCQIHPLETHEALSSLFLFANKSLKIEPVSYGEKQDISRELYHQCKFATLIFNSLVIIFKLAFPFISVSSAMFYFQTYFGRYLQYLVHHVRYMGILIHSTESSQRNLFKRKIMCLKPL